MRAILNAGILLFATSMALSAGAEAQAQAVHSEILDRAIHAAADEARRVSGSEGPIVLDSRTMRMRTGDRALDGAAARSDQAIAEIARVLGARVERGEEIRVCRGRGPAGCRLEGAEILLATGDPVVRDGLVTVDVLVYFSTGSDRQPVGLREFVVTLTPDDSGWRVERLTTVRAS